MLFDIDGTFFVHVVWFILLMVALTRWMFTPFLELRDRRRTATQERVESSRKRLDDARFREAQLRSELDAHRLAASLKRQEARREFQRQADAARAEADRKAEEELAQAEIQLQFDAEKVKARLEQNLPQYVAGFSAKVLKDA